MLRKEYIVGALIIAVSFFGLVGTSFAESVTHDEEQISMFASSDEMATGNEVSKQLRFSAPAGAVSNLDHTTASTDEGLYVLEEVQSGNTSSLQCVAKAGHISNLDHTTANIDPSLCS